MKDFKFIDKDRFVSAVLLIYSDLKKNDENDFSIFMQPEKLLHAILNGRVTASISFQPNMSTSRPFC